MLLPLFSLVSEARKHDGFREIIVMTVNIVKAKSEREESDKGTQNSSAVKFFSHVESFSCRNIPRE